VARIAGINIPTTKRVIISLTYIYGIGSYRSRKICKEANICENTIVSSLSDSEFRRIREAVSSLYRVEGDLRMEVSLNVKSLIDMKAYKGIRHIRKLPTRGQRTKTNARTRRGKAIAIAGKKKVTK
jgi:small subunit ribosomal protein S13